MHSRASMLRWPIWPRVVVVARSVSVPNSASVSYAVMLLNYTPTLPDEDIPG